MLRKARTHSAPVDFHSLPPHVQNIIRQGIESSGTDWTSLALIMEEQRRAQCTQRRRDTIIAVLIVAFFLLTVGIYFWHLAK